MRSELRAFEMTDAGEWNRFVESAPYHAFPQLWEWGEVPGRGGLAADARWRSASRRIGPWRARSCSCGGSRSPAGTWRMSRAVPSAAWTTPRRAWRSTRRLRTLGRDRKIATVRADPEARPDTPYGQALLGPPWRAAPKVQPPTTRIIDLTAGEEALRAGLKKKHRQYVSKAEREGVTVERFDGSDATRGHRSRARGLQPHLPLHRRTSRVRGARAARTTSASGRHSRRPAASA